MAGKIRPLHELIVNHVTRPRRVAAAVKEHRTHIGLRGFVRASMARLGASKAIVVNVGRSGFVS